MKKLVMMLMALLLFLTACSKKENNGGEEPSAKVYNVGILQFVQHEALDSATEGFKQALKDKLGDQVVFEDQNAAGEPTNCSMIANQFVSEGVDLIFANATPALQAAATATGDIPVVATSVTSFKVALDIANWNGTTGINVTGTSDLAPLDQQAAQVLELFPEAKKVAIFFCSSEPNSVFQAEEIEKHFANLGLETERFTFTDSNDIAQVANAASESADVVYIPTDNMAASYATFEQFSKPVIAGEAGICKACGVATISITYFDIGYRAGEMAFEILVNGSNPASMKVEEVSKTTKLFNSKHGEVFGVAMPSDYEEVK